MNQKYFQVGSIITTHGLKGEVKVYPTTEDPKRFEDLKKILLEDGSDYITLSIKSVKYFKNIVILGFKEYSDINQVEKLRGKKLFVSREDAIELYEDEYYIPDLIGIRVIDENGNDIGVLRDVLETGANDVYIIKTESEKELLIPAIKECILSVDIENEIMTIHIMDGLLDL